MNIHWLELCHLWDFKVDLYMYQYRPIVLGWEINSMLFVSSKVFFFLKKTSLSLLWKSVLSSMYTSQSGYLQFERMQTTQSMCLYYEIKVSSVVSSVREWFALLFSNFLNVSFVNLKCSFVLFIVWYNRVYLVSSCNPSFVFSKQLRDIKNF